MKGSLSHGEEILLGRGQKQTDRSVFRVIWVRDKGPKDEGGTTKMRYTFGYTSGYIFEDWANMIYWWVWYGKRERGSLQCFDFNNYKNEGAFFW